MNSTSIAYGKIEVRAKIPRGDWLWPAIWMLPKDNKYGAWPMSGEIDVSVSIDTIISWTDYANAAAASSWKHVGTPRRMLRKA